MIQIVSINGPNSLMLGRQGENQAKEIQIDCSSWLCDAPGCTLILSVMRPNEDTAYLPETTQMEGVLSWVVSSIDTAIAGHGKAEVRAVLGEKVIKSHIFNTYIYESITAEIEPTPPEVPSWLNDLANYAQKAYDSANKALAATLEATEATEKANASAEQATASAEKADKATEGATNAAENANEAADATNEAIKQATTATNAANDAVAKANEATEKANLATQNATTATQLTIEATQNAVSATTKAIEATTKADEATKNATDATNKANEAAQNATDGETVRQANEELRKQQEQARADAEADRVANDEIRRAELAEAVSDAQESATEANQAAETATAAKDATLEKYDQFTADLAEMPLDATAQEIVGILEEGTASLNLIADRYADPPHDDTASEAAEALEWIAELYRRYIFNESFGSTGKEEQNV